MRSFGRGGRWLHPRGEAAARPAPGGDTDGRPAGTRGQPWGRNIDRLSWVLMVLGVAAACVAGLQWRGSVASQDSRAADVHAAEIQARLSEQISQSNDIGEDMGRLISLDPSLTNAQLQQWFARAKADGRADDIVVEAYVANVPEGQLGAVQARDQQNPSFDLPLPFRLSPPGARANYCLMTLGVLNLPSTISTHNPNVLAAMFAVASFLSPGTDMCSSAAAPLLTGSAVSATTTAEPLAQIFSLEGGQSASVGQRSVKALFGNLTPFFEMTPVYARTPVPAGQADRLGDVAGWVLTVIDAQPILGPVVHGQPGLAVSLGYHNAMGSSATLVHGGSQASLTVQRTVPVGDGGRFVATMSIPMQSALTPNEEGLIVGFGVLLMVVLLFALMRVLAMSRVQQAMELVAETTGALEHQARHDALTGLANRAAVLERLEAALARGRAGQGGALALLVIDLDGFKDVNDAFGHEVGDELLQSVAVRLVEMIGVSTTIGRLGGDEFVVVVDGAPNDDPEQLAKSILGAMSLPIRLPSVPGPVSLGASIGVASGLRASARDLLRDADIALYEAKSNGKNRYAVFRSEMRTAVLNRFDLESELRTAMRANQFFLVYQPTFDLEGMGVTGVEALLRWHHPTRGIVPPVEFVPVLESSGMIVDVGRWVLAEACRQVRMWHNEGYPVSVAVNVSGRQFEGSNLVQDVRTALVRSGLDAHALVIEITETVLMREPAVIADKLRQIKDLGVRVAIDDFGTGYSSMAYLQQFPVDILKIDRSFVTGMVESSEGAALVRALVQLGKALGLTTLAEGIEDEIQLYRLRAEKCDAGQGYLFAKPLSAADAERFMAEKTAARASQAVGHESSAPGTTMTAAPPTTWAVGPRPASPSTGTKPPAAGAASARPSPPPLPPSARRGGRNLPPYPARRPLGGPPANGASTNGAGANGASANGAGANGAGANGASVNGAGANGAGANGASANGAGANGAPRPAAPGDVDGAASVAGAPSGPDDA